MTGTSGPSSRDEALENFNSWFVGVLDKLYQPPEAGFPILLITFPILERYMRCRAKVFPPKPLDDNCMKELLTIFPDLGTRDESRKFWNVYRNGLLHTLTFSEKDRGGLALPVGGVSGDIPGIIMREGENFLIHPKKFSQKVVSEVVANFETFKEDPKDISSLPKVILMQFGVSTSGSASTLARSPQGSSRSGK